MSATDTWLAPGRLGGRAGWGRIADLGVRCSLVGEE